MLTRRRSSEQKIQRRFPTRTWRVGYAAPEPVLAGSDRWLSSVRSAPYAGAVIRDPNRKGVPYGQSRRNSLVYPRCLSALLRPGAEVGGTRVGLHPERR